MAIYTLTELTLTTAQQTQLDTYIATAVSTGATNGIRTTVNLIGTTGTLAQREWSNATTAGDYITFVQTLDPTAIYAAVVAPLIP